MIRHRKNTPTLYEYTIKNNAGAVAFTLWFLTRKPSARAVYKKIITNIDTIKENTGAKEVIWNGDTTITAGEYSGKMTGRTLLEARGYYKKQQEKTQ